MSKERINKMLDQQINQVILSLRRDIIAAEHLYDRPQNSVKLLAVSKGQSSLAVRQTFAAGINDFGESYLQEALKKQEDLIDLPITWHFIGPMQSNKIKLIAQHFSWAHSLERIDFAKKLSQYRPTNQTALNICIQINLDNEPTKAGIAPNELADFIHQLKGMPGIKLRGLMCLPQALMDPLEQYQSLVRLTTLFNKINDQLDIKLDTLSMGMSTDYHAAIRAGSTLVRIGRGIFSQQVAR